VSEKRIAFLAWLKDQESKPYLWGQKGPDGFDCSGLVTAGLHAIGGPDWRQTHGSARLHAELPATNAPKPGDLVFYGATPKQVDHVMVWMGDGTVFGASGGGSNCTTVQAAMALGACVHSKGDVHYRRDCVGFASAPLD
jgi:cell wall-associated NlpC family hydrolase